VEIVLLHFDPNTLRNFFLDLVQQNKDLNELKESWIVEKILSEIFD